MCIAHDEDTCHYMSGEFGGMASTRVEAKLCPKSHILQHIKRKTLYLFSSSAATQVKRRSTVFSKHRSLLNRWHQRRRRFRICFKNSPKQSLLRLLEKSVIMRRFCYLALTRKTEFVFRRLKNEFRFAGQCKAQVEAKNSIYFFVRFFRQPQQALLCGEAD
jgi:hypothetical protein